MSECIPAYNLRSGSFQDTTVLFDTTNDVNNISGINNLTVEGVVICDTVPTDPSHLVNKQYVDNSGGGSLATTILSAISSTGSVFFGMSVGTTNIIGSVGSVFKTIYFEIPSYSGTGSSSLSAMNLTLVDDPSNLIHSIIGVNDVIGYAFITNNSSGINMNAQRIRRGSNNRTITIPITDSGTIDDFTMYGFVSYPVAT